MGQLIRVSGAVVLMMAAAHGPAAYSDPLPDEIVGTASVIDGDTIEMHGKRIRLDGFDTPERGSVCGRINVYQKAALALSDFIGSRTVTCEVSGEDGRGRSVAQCKVGEESLAEYMVENGWGRDWPRYSDGAYADEEKRAREAGTGLWGLACPDDLWGTRNYD